ncbi:metallophosphoesterase family protein [Ideonella sp. BN130291]|uniref:metallophosphoesterase family protein n=1 Tax=Ideonella sp. BN130291 TaxID=3112940 RepID=UPI002E276F6D|nr:metallophosphoesterase family protein [Ideonella sp. BN130291]
MRRIVHLSDLHFGRVDEVLLQPLLDRVQALAPHVVVVSGDLTQRARTREFEQARAFLARLPKPQVVVPGNHDVPLYNVFDRFLRPLTKYRRYIERDLDPLVQDEQVAVLGVNTARSLVAKNGRINQRQMAEVQRALCKLGPEVTKIVVTHHPFDLPDSAEGEDLVGRAEQAMAVFAQCGVDVLLAGHFHTSHSQDSGARYPQAGYEALVVAAGTATSTRGRGEANSFNLLRVQKGLVEVERFEWMPERVGFHAAGVQRFERAQRGWRPLA